MSQPTSSGHPTGPGNNNIANRRSFSKSNLPPEKQNINLDSLEAITKHIQQLDDVQNQVFNLRYELTSMFRFLANSISESDSPTVVFNRLAYEVKKMHIDLETFLATYQQLYPLLEHVSKNNSKATNLNTNSANSDNLNIPNTHMTNIGSPANMTNSAVNTPNMSSATLNSNNNMMASSASSPYVSGMYNLPNSNAPVFNPTPTSNASTPNTGVNSNLNSAANSPVQHIRSPVLTQHQHQLQQQNMHNNPQQQVMNQAQAQRISRIQMQQSYQQGQE